MLCRRLAMRSQGVIFFDTGMDHRQSKIDDQTNGRQNNRFLSELEFHHGADSL
jgi:hypothetical protein